MSDIKHFILVTLFGENTKTDKHRKSMNRMLPFKQLLEKQLLI